MTRDAQQAEGPQAETRARVLRAHGAEDSQLEELLTYSEPVFEVSPEDSTRAYPLADEESAAVWQDYADCAEQDDILKCLRGDLVQLNFPIAAGISQNPAYLAATRKGELESAAEAPGLQLEDAGGLQLFVHPTPAGRIPVLVAPNRNDFESLVRALTRRNEPAPIPPAVGATMVAGYNNWGRVRRYRAAWEQENPAKLWQAIGFREMVPQKSLYQDRFILLSRGRYSDVPASSLGLDSEVWLEKSLTIRLEHECAHYFTRRVFGAMRNALHDEIIADYFGIVGAEGRYCADWFLRFLGLEDSPRFRESGRLGTYRGDPPLSDGAFKVLQSVVSSAAANLEAADRVRGQPLTMSSKARILCALCELSLEEIAAEGADQLLARAFTRA